MVEKESQELIRIAKTDGAFFFNSYLQLFSLTRLVSSRARRYNDDLWIERSAHDKKKKTE